MSEQMKQDAQETYEPLYDTDDDTSAPKHPQYAAREYETKTHGGEPGGGFDGRNFHSDYQPAYAPE
jgi:hypothetical protein